MSEYISREAARPDAFCEGVSCQECPFCKDPIKGGCRVDDYIKDIPAADVRPVVRGKWVMSDRQEGWVTCSVCKKMKFDGRMAFSPTLFVEWGLNFCPNCGADMRQTGDENV